MQTKQQKSQPFLQQLQFALSQTTQQQHKLITNLLKQQNARNKLKIIKKILQSSSPEKQIKNQQQLELQKVRKIFQKYMGKAIVKQYIYGNIQSKPIVLNIFKVLRIQPKILIELNQQNKNKIQIFEDCKKIIQIIQMLTISNKLTKEDIKTIKQSQLIVKIYQILLKQLQKGKISIVNNQFRTKWLQYFVQVLRCVNYIIRFIGVAEIKIIENNEINKIETQQVNNNIQNKYKQITKKIYLYTKQCIQNSYMFIKQVITQLYLIIVYINKDLQQPQEILNKIHYYHACTIIKGQNTIKKLIKLSNQIKDTQYKCQLIPILLKSFQQTIQRLNKQNKQNNNNNNNKLLDQQLKNNAFDSIIPLFDIGRSIYSYLQQIIDIIIINGGNWSLQGNFVRKFFITKILLKYVNTNIILNLWPNCLQDCFRQSGNMTMPYVTDCAQALLSKLYLQNNKNYKQWLNIWIEPYKKLLLSGNRTFIRGITQFINPILIKINSSNSLLLREISKMPQQNLCTQLGIISLIKCYKEIGKIQSKYNVYIEQQQRKKQEEKAKNRENKKKKQKQSKKQVQQQQKINKQQVKNDSISKQEQKKQNKQLKTNQSLNFTKSVYIHLDDPQFYFGRQFLLDLLLSNDSMTSLQTLDFLITARKPSILIHPQQMKLIIQFYKNCLKTSMPEYRKNYLNLTRRMLERFRKNYQKDVVTKKQQNNKKNTQFYQQFIKFLNQLIDLCFLNIYPDSIFEITNPALQILLLVMNLFGPKGCQIRKGTFIEPSNILQKKTTYFKLQNFQNLIICLQSSYESIRSIANEIIKNYTNFTNQGIKILQNIFQKSIKNTNKLSIKNYEFACRMITYISTIKLQNNKNIIKQIPQKYKLNQLNISEYLLNILKQRYQIFKNQFIDQSQIYYQNLIHGILTCFSYILQDISKKDKFQQNSIQFEQINTFLKVFFKQMIKILNFSVEISSANISTVVLDTITNASQTDKKLTVDCRGHFLQQKKNIGSLIDSTALISSMQNEEEGIQNTLVVSFYLLTRQAGLVFQSIGSLMSNKYVSNYVPKKQLLQLINTYFYALINLKHMGSVDRISNGLQKMSKIIYDQQDKQLIKIPQQLLSKLLSYLNDNKFTNILRRSAGIPYAFCCLLKCQAIKRKLLIQNTILQLLRLSKQSPQIAIEMRIHSLNILKKLFQDSDLKSDLDIYLSQAFISSIKGFTSQEWGVRNSSLMLFSVLANRTIGIKPTYNLLQFFHKCPQMLQFIKNQLQFLSRESQNKSTMYPPLYPIVLLLSRLLPFDIKQKSRITIKGNINKQLRKQQLLTLLPLLNKAGNNHNYMGRVMTAKAILPFMNLINIIPYSLILLDQYINNTKNIHHLNNNMEHYRLTECYQLLDSYFQIMKNNNIINANFNNNNSNNNNNNNNINNNNINDDRNNDNKQIINQQSNNMNIKIYTMLYNNCELLNWKQQNNICPTVHEIYLRIYKLFINQYYSSTQIQNYNILNGNIQKLLYNIIKHVQQLFIKLINLQQMGDLGHSFMYKTGIQLLYTCYSLLIKNFNINGNIGEIFIQYLNNKNQNINKIIQNNKYYIDYEIYSLVLQKIAQLLKIYKQKGINQNKLQKITDQWLNNINIQNIANDDTIIQILHLLSINPKILEQNKLKQLKITLHKIKQITQNKHMKVAIFDFILSISKQKQFFSQCIHKQYTQYLQTFLYEYSNPNQLQDLRQCCILYLQQTKQIKQNLLIVYIRILEDQQYQIRKRGALSLSKLLRIKPCNQSVVIRELLCKFIGGFGYIQKLKLLGNNNNKNINQTKQDIIQPMKLDSIYNFFIKILQQNSDYSIRMKNHEQQRIFSYDKPNKYRTDINTIYEILTFMNEQTFKYILQKISKQANYHQNSTNKKLNIKNIIQNYKQDIMDRDQFVFQYIIRSMLQVYGNQNKQQRQMLMGIKNLQGIFLNIMNRITIVCSQKKD